MRRRLWDVDGQPERWELIRAFAMEALEGVGGGGDILMCGFGPTPDGEWYMMSCSRTLFEEHGQGDQYTTVDFDPLSTLTRPWMRESPTSVQRPGGPVGGRQWADLVETHPAFVAIMAD